MLTCHRTMKSRVNWVTEMEIAAMKAWARRSPTDRKEVMIQGAILIWYAVGALFMFHHIRQIVRAAFGLPLGRTY